MPKYVTVKIFDKMTITLCKFSVHDNNINKGTKIDKELLKNKLNIEKDMRLKLFNFNADINSLVGDDKCQSSHGVFF